MNLENTIEALLFWKGEPLTIKELSKSLNSSVDEVLNAVSELEKNLSTRGLVLLRKNTINKDGEIDTLEQEITLGTSPEAGALIEKLTKEELAKDLGKASLETLSIILYKGPVKRSEIDNIRGVNSNFILRNLLIRGLIDKKPDPRDSRATLYGASFELLSFLGVSKIEDLPNFEQVQEEINKFKEHSAELESEKIEEKKEETVVEEGGDSENQNSDREDNKNKEEGLPTEETSETI